MHNLKRTRMLLTVRDNADSPLIVSATGHDHITRLELDIVQDLSSFKVKSNGVVWLDIWIWVTDSSTVMCDCIRDAFRSTHHLLHTTQLVSCFLPDDFVQRKSRLGVIQQAKVFFRLINLHHIHKSSWIKHIGS